MSTIALTNAAGGERVQETVEIMTPQVTIVPTAKLAVSPMNTTVDYVFTTLINNRINLRPSYQRNYKWQMKKFRSYITHVWANGAMLQSITLDNLSDDDKYDSECLDGNLV